MITLSDGTTTITLPEDLLWSDEYDWSAVDQSQERGLTGSLILQAMAMTLGRPITLAPEDDRSAAMTRAVLDQVYTWAAIPLKELTLTLRGIARDVVFRHDDKPAVAARPWIHYSSMDSTDYYLVTLKFLTV